MGRVFSLLAAVAVLIILIVDGGVYWLSSTKIAQTKQDSATTVANTIAATLSQQIDLLNRTLNKMALDPEVLDAVTRADPAELTTVAAKLEKYFPDALKIRLLLPGVSEPDETGTPRMGFADLDMVRETFIGNQPPGIQGYEGTDRHLAITRRIMDKDQVVGVILASLNYDSFNKSLQAAAVKDGIIELKQAQLVLAASGKRVDSGQSESLQTKVPNTDWEIVYHYAVGADLAEIILITSSFAVVPLLLTLLAFFAGYRWLSGLLMQDLGNVLNACKDMMTNKPPGSYPVTLSETSAVITALMHFKQTEIDIKGLTKYGFIDDIPDYDINEPFNNGEDNLLANPVEEAIDNPEIIELSTAPKKIDEMDAIFRTFDIHGIVDKTLTRERIYDIGRALGTDAKKLGCKTIVMGQDRGISSPILAEALAQGIVSTGSNVLDIGKVPTPMLYFVALHTQGRFGVMITGSHNFNSLEMVINGETLAGERIQQLRQCIANQGYASGEIGKIDNNDSYANEYIGTISEDIQIVRPMRVVLDCGNGVTGELGPELLKTLDCEVVELFCDVEETSPDHDPDPGKPENLAQLIASVKDHKADLGIAFNSDGDRLGVVDSDGNIIWPDRQMMLFAKDVLAGKPGAEIIYDVKCTRHLANQIKKYGGRPLMWKTGHALMKAKLKETGAALAGEMSGHIFFNDRWFGFDDALYSAARLIEILSKDSLSSAEIFAQFPDSINTPELNIDIEEGEIFTFMERMFAEESFTDGKISTIDGMRVDFSNGSGLVRVSNTPPSLVICFEADSNEALRNIKNQFRQLMKKIKPNIVLPF